MRAFIALMTDGRELHVDADFLTYSVHEVRFWVKPHWYSRRRCVGVLWDQYVLAVRVDGDKGDAAWLKDAGVKVTE